MTPTFTVHHMAQRSPEWYAIRAGRLTGSVAEKMLASIKSGESAQRRDLRLLLATERVTGLPQVQDFVSPDMQWGIDHEADALMRYETHTGNLVNLTGFVAHPTLMAGASLDAHLGDFQAIVSVKCPKSATHLRYLKTSTIPTDYIPQMLHELWITGAMEYHFVSYDPRFPQGLQVHVIIEPRVESAVLEYAKKATEFLAEVDRDVADIQTLAGLNAVLHKAVRS